MKILKVFSQIGHNLFRMSSHEGLRIQKKRKNNRIGNTCLRYRAGFRYGESCPAKADSLLFLYCGTPGICGCPRKFRTGFQFSSSGAVFSVSGCFFPVSVAVISGSEQESMSSDTREGIKRRTKLPLPLPFM